jgi:MoaA/NifB/PqqE/SkfB family radical SAM enzyme
MKIRKTLFSLEGSTIENSILNDFEFNSKNIVLRSSPRTIFIQAAGPCNSNCVFCSRGSGYEIFDLEAHKRCFEEKLYPYISKADTLVFTGSGEFLLLSEAEEILDFFDSRFPHVGKQFSTNGSPLTESICRKIIESQGRYTIHISLHASNYMLHKVLTRSDNFRKIIDQLEYLVKLKKGKHNLEVRLIFVATTINIEDLPSFVRLAESLGVDRVVCYYNYIYIPTQKYLSCFFKQDITNHIFDEAKNLSQKLKIPLDLPPKFGLESYSENGVCREPWSQMMTDSQGHVLPCDASEDCYLNIEKTKSFMDDIWNSEYYLSLRKSLIEKKASCFKHCFRANPSSVNDFCSHVIHRGQRNDIDIFWSDNF